MAARSNNQTHVSTRLQVGTGALWFETDVRPHRHLLRGADVASAPALCAMLTELGDVVPTTVLQAALAGVWSPEAQHALRSALPIADAAAA